MPSPFPGMDPYLENPAWWPSVHQRLITYIGDVLSSLMPSHYVVNIGERVYVLKPEQWIYPDVVVLQTPLRPAPGEGSSGGTAVATQPVTTTALAVSDAPWHVRVGPQEVREVFIEIVPVGNESRVITAIEILSPSNKATGSEGRQLYKAKQRDVLASQSHLLEIDLLRAGEHTVAPDREYLILHGVWDYLASLHRAGQGGDFEVWPISLRGRLPRITVPLAEGDPDVVLDLQPLFNRCYDAGTFARRVDYRRDPRPALRPADAEWTNLLLREKGLRS